ncbi:hypothetical protein Poli38472_010893 [Pythium oligandrum]|uniref:WRKY19-like zinc finger domain-containing protein n=1 Tax=Pythium oligandrum TaxID=41045 RepID=A0A8K1FFM8_PYTOL|nr:hypothetical protein Poli38472_010893 [Pythium oligandrum]|eukprot:TMW61830.1 hypothetical protein Poli38472_010893 [Pythium oligandrum]
MNQWTYGPHEMIQETQTSASSLSRDALPPLPPRRRRRASVSASERAQRLFTYRTTSEAYHIDHRSNQLEGDDLKIDRKEPNEPDEQLSGRPEQTKAEKRRGRMCRVDGCENYIVHNGFCCRHGGSRKCSSEGCTSTAKYMGRCWKHGGSKWCNFEGCLKRAKAKGRCWAHGGGTKCKQAECTKVAVSNGLCWAHGGGRRCIYDECNRPGYERTHGFCDKHYEFMQNVDYFEL